MNLAKLKESLLIKPPNLGERADVKVVIVTNPQTKVQNKGNKMILTSLDFQRNNHTMLVESE